MKTWITWAGMVGHVARAIVFGLVGVFLVKAAIDYKANEAIGLDGALAKLYGHSYGPWLLGAVAAGLVAFGIFSITEARYRRISPGAPGAPAFPVLSQGTRSAFTGCLHAALGRRRWSEATQPHPKEDHDEQDKAHRTRTQLDPRPRRHRRRHRRSRQVGLPARQARRRAARRRRHRHLPRPHERRAPHAAPRAARRSPQVATAQGKTVAGLEDAIVADAKTHLDADVTAGTLTAAQEATMLAEPQAHVDDMVNSTGPAGRRPGRHGGPGGGPGSAAIATTSA